MISYLMLLKAPKSRVEVVARRACRLSDGSSERRSSEAWEQLAKPVRLRLRIHQTLYWLALSAKMNLAHQDREFPLERN